MDADITLSLNRSTCKRNETVPTRMSHSGQGWCQCGCSRTRPVGQAFAQSRFRIGLKGDNTIKTRIIESRKGVGVAFDGKAAHFFSSRLKFGAQPVKRSVFILVLPQVQEGGNFGPFGTRLN